MIFSLAARMIRDVGKIMLSKLSFCRALRTLALTIDEVVRFDNKIHDVRSKCDHTKSWAQKFGIAGSSNGAKKA